LWTILVIVFNPVRQLPYDAEDSLLDNSGLRYQSIN
jgi:hypothetical protein